MRLDARLAAFAALSLTLAACSRRRAEVVPAPEATVTIPTTPSANDDAARIERERRDREAREAADRAERERLAREAARGRLEATIYFEFDRSDLTTDARAALDAKLELLRANPSVQLLVAGHTDERGADEYNLALGQRRAAAARRYLVQRGIAESRVATTSRGEEQPTCTSSDEGCWSRNRRDAFSITAGTVTP